MFRPKRQSARVTSKLVADMFRSHASSATIQGLDPGPTCAEELPPAAMDHAAAEVAAMQTLQAERVRNEANAAAACRREAALQKSVHALDARVAELEEERACLSDSIALAERLHATRMKEVVDELSRCKREAADTAASLQGQLAVVSEARASDAAVARLYTRETERVLAAAGASRAQLERALEEARGHLACVGPLAASLRATHTSDLARIAKLEGVRQADAAALTAANVAQATAVKELAAGREKWEAERSVLVAKVGAAEGSLATLRRRLADVETTRVRDANAAFERQIALVAAQQRARVQDSNRAADSPSSPALLLRVPRVAATVPRGVDAATRKRPLSDASERSEEEEDGGATTESDTDVETSRRSELVRVKPVSSASDAVAQPDAESNNAAVLPRTPTALHSIAMTPQHCCGGVAKVVQPFSVPFPCRICPRVFLTSAGRARHRLMHARFICRQCRESFKSPGELQDHETAEHV